MSKFNFDPKFFRRVISKCDKSTKIQPLTLMMKEAVEVFYEEFDYYPDIAAFAPGAFTIMGDHLDYNKGYIVQGALPLVNVVVGKCLDSVKCKILTTSKDIQGLRKAVFPVSHHKQNNTVFPDWVNLIEGVIRNFPCKKLKGFDAVIHSSVPMLQGYGSSAALQVGFFTFLEAICGKKTCENKMRKAKLCQLGERKSHDSHERRGDWSNFTSSLALQNTVVTINCCTGETSMFDMKDIDILFLITYPNFELEVKDMNLIPRREMELKLAAELLGLQHIKDATEEDLQILATMEDPSRESVIKILTELGYNEETIMEFVEDLFYFPKAESLPEEESLYAGEATFFEFDMDSPSKDYVSEESELEQIMFGEKDDSTTEPVPCSLEDQTKGIKLPAPVPRVSYFKQRIAELCEGKAGSQFELPNRVCEEINCLGGIENLSVASDLTVAGKLLKRVRHVVTENMRCLALPDIINRLDYVEFGSKLIQSHLSLMLDYEVSCQSLDDLVELALSVDRCYGAKMMSGGGTLTLLHRSVVEELIEKIVEMYGENFQFYLVFPSAGAEILNVGMKSNPKSSLSNPYPTLREVMRRAVENFQATYKYRPTHGGFSPGVINILGDHADFNHGFVLSFSLNLATVVVGAFNGTSKVRVATTADLSEAKKVIFPLPYKNELSPGKVRWAKLVRGVIVHFKGELSGFDCLIESTLRCGSGLTSKTALVLAFYTFLEEISGFKAPSLYEKAYQCMLARHEFTSVLSGIGDYMVSIKAKENYAILIDTRSNLSSPIPFQDPSVVFLLTFTRFQIKSNRVIMYQRMEECYDVAKALGGKTLRCLTIKDLDSPALSKVHKTSIRRARHILTENERVLKAAEALKNNDYETLGELMVESHNSLREHFGMTNADLDFLVTRAMEVDGVLGSRIPSTGYFNCTVSLVKRWAVDDLIEYLQNNCSELLTFYVVNPSSCCGPVKVKDFVETLPGPEFVFEKIFSF